MSFNKNMGQVDRAVRLVVALVLIGLIVFDVVGGVLAVVLGVLAAVFVVTSFISFCPLYLPFKFSTKK